MKRGRTGKSQQQGKLKLARAMGTFYADRAWQNATRPKARKASGISNASVFQNVSRRPELKFLDLLTGFTLPVATMTGTLALLNGCAQGTDANQHIGRQTTMKSIYWIWNGFLAPTTTGSTSVRMVILYDKEAEGAAPTIAAGAQTDAFNQDTIYAQQNLNNRDRFIVLMDEIVECVGTAGPQAFMRKGYRKVNLPVVFNAGAGANIAAINTGSIYAFQWTNSNLAVAAGTSDLQTRIRFEDA